MFTIDINRYLRKVKKRKAFIYKKKKKMYTNVIILPSSYMSWETSSLEYNLRNVFFENIF